MAYIISKKIVTNYTIKQLVVEFLTDVKSYLKIRNSQVQRKNIMTSCFKCGYKFQDSDTSIGLAITDKTNVVLCKLCSKRIAALEDPDIEIIENFNIKHCKLDKGICSDQAGDFYTNEIKCNSTTKCENQI